MDYIWFLFDFVGRINRVRFWLAALIIACWMAFLSGLAIGSAKLFGSSALNGSGFDTNDIFRVVDPGRGIAEGDDRNLGLSRQLEIRVLRY